MSMMKIGVIGVNHQSGSLALREKFTRVFQLEFGPKGCSIIDSVLLVTCNRVELYFSSKQLSVTHVDILEVLSRHGLGEAFYALYSYFGRECFFHLGSVITGMDSAIFGESDIQHQVKIAYEQRRRQVSLRHDLHYLFQKALKIGKELRTSFLSPPKERELPLVIERMTKRLGIDIESSSILFIGHSRLNRKMIAFFQFKKSCRLTLCTRVKEVEVPSCVELVDWGELKHWRAYDLVICATYHDAFVLKRGGDLRELDRRTVVFDLGVPRNVDPELGSQQGIDLYHLSQLEKRLSGQRKRNQGEITLCCRALDQSVNRQMALFVKRRRAKCRYLSKLPSGAALIG